MEITSRENWVTCVRVETVGEGRWRRRHEELLADDAFGTGGVEGNVSGHQGAVTWHHVCGRTWAVSLTKDTSYIYKSELWNNMCSANIIFFYQMIIYQSKLPNLLWLLLFKCEDVLLLSVLWGRGGGGGVVFEYCLDKTRNVMTALFIL